MEGFRSALGLKGAVVEGEAFDRDLQERRKQERIAERERAAKEKADEAKARARTGRPAPLGFQRRGASPAP